MMFRRVIALSLVTVKEGICDRSLYGIFLFALLVMGLNVAIADFFMRDIGKVTVDMNLSALSLAGLLLVFFVAINLLAKDIDKKTIHMVLAKPFSRAEYIWGKYIGLMLAIFLSLLILTTISCVTIGSLKSLYPGYFFGFQWSVFFVAVFFIFFQLALLCAIVVFFTTVSSTSFVTLIFSIATYVVGVTLEEVVFYLRTAEATGEVVASNALQNILGVVMWLVPNFAAFDYKLEAAHGIPLDLSELVLSCSYGLMYIFVLLILSSLIFKRREFN